ncbi:MAG TPA: DUF6222 family protein [Pseudonocardiaceae bacterium]|jgi:hypothetical protein|nr:DUF6222 family protein [Pseudonocardiaceae bacterium]
MHHHDLTLHTNNQTPAPATDRDYEDDYDYDPPVGSLPRLYRGVVWSDIVAEINSELEARKAA